jgi:hypothetical protein
MLGVVGENMLDPFTGNVQYATEQDAYAFAAIYTPVH